MKREPRYQKSYVKIILKVKELIQENPRDTELFVLFCTFLNLPDLLDFLINSDLASPIDSGILFRILCQNEIDQKKVLIAVLFYLYSDQGQLKC